MINPLELLFRRTVRERWCTGIQCTTCGSFMFRDALARYLKRYGPAEWPFSNYQIKRMYRDLAEIDPPPGQGAKYEEILKGLFKVVSPSPHLDDELGDSWARDVLSSMRDRYQRRLEARRIHDLANDPNEVAKRRAEKKAKRTEEHKKRMELQRLKALEWHKRNKVNP